MPSLPDTAVIILLGLLLFGPKGLAQIARQLGKLMGEFRRASNEFRMQMEEELRISEQADRQKQIAAVEAAAPVTPALDSTPAEEVAEDRHLPPTDTAEVSEVAPSPEPLPIATSGELSIMPPATGLPASRSSSLAASSLAASSLSSLIDAVPKVDPPGTHTNGDHSEEHQRSAHYANHTGDLPQDAATEESVHG